MLLPRPDDVLFDVGLANGGAVTGALVSFEGVLVGESAADGDTVGATQPPGGQPYTGQ